ncbi:hypothetical protein COCVIDRAFT_23724 [Bipolaris victoriae FI3]|uniref:Uncharacterized protein n=1 Tax=Bipolaris victoriae (strain FI3) TaxID=930091 RepID=W7F2J8_BIPV3|nr:hypothetical protein COCVIDRAFT_23724 [Bipolaris victoriae FI3]
MDEVDQNLTWEELNAFGEDRERLREEMENTISRHDESFAALKQTTQVALDSLKATEEEDKELKRRMDAYLQSTEADRYEDIVDPISNKDDTLVKQLFATVSQCLDDVRQERDESPPSTPLGDASLRTRDESSTSSPKRPALAALLNNSKRGRSFTLDHRQTIVSQQDSNQTVAASQGNRSGSPVSRRGPTRQSGTLQQSVLPSSPSVPRMLQSTTAVPFSSYPEHLSSTSGGASDFTRRFQETGRSNHDTALMPPPMLPRRSLIQLDNNSSRLQGSSSN